MRPVTKTQIKAKAIRNYKEIQAGKVSGIKLRPLKFIQVGAITFEL